MIKKTLLLSSIPMIILPAFVILSCAGTTQMQGTTESPGANQSPEQQKQSELARVAFLEIKLSLSQIAKGLKPNSSTEFEEIINNRSFIPIIKKSEFKVQTEDNNFFVVNYKLTVYSGTFDQIFNNKDEIVNKTEELTGSLKFPILALQPGLNPPTDPSETSEVSELSFLNFKLELVRAASQTSLSDTDAAKLLKNNLLQKFSYDSELKTGLRKFDLKVEGNFFIFDYELEVPKGLIWDFAQDPSQLPPGREILKGTIKATGLKN